MTGRAPALRGIGARLLGAMTLVVLAGGLAAWLVAGAVGPALFHRHMLEAAQAGGTTAETTALHAEEAFASAGAVTVAVALGASVLTSLLVTLVLARRMGASLGSMSEVAAQVAAGHFEARVPRPRIGGEFDELADSVNRMAARLKRDEALRSRLIADVAHELRTPVTTIAAYLDGLEDGVRELGPETVDVLRSQTSRLTRLAADLGAVTRAESGELRLDRQEAEPRALLVAAAAAVRERYADAGVELIVDAADDLPRVPVDADRFGQVLGNLLDNALRHTPRCGRVTLSAVRENSGRGGSVRFAVTDTGEGIDPVHLPHVFERFYRVDTARDRARGGSGIGLAITRALVHAHGGTIGAESAGPGTGARFVIDLPVAVGG